MGQLLVDHALSYALTATAYVPAVYLQQFWKTVRLVVNANETIRFTVDRKEITYTVDMFRSTLKLLVETPENPFIAPATLKFIQPFLKIVGYQGNVDKVSAFFTKYLAQPWQTMFKQKKYVIQYPRFAKLIITDLMKKFPSISQRLEHDYHSIKDDIQFMSVYTTGNVTAKGMLIPDEFLTDDIRATQEYKEYEKKKKRKQVAEATSSPKKSLKVTIKQKKPSTTPIPPLTKVQEKLMEEDIEKMVDGEDEESYASEFADFVFLNEEEDSGTRLEPGSHKENPETIDDDDDDVKYDNKDDDNDDDNDDHTDHTLVKTQVAGSLENRNEKM
ncbi:hypothetical protein Tco_0439031 [Tanacetum coccineum]